MGELEPRFIVTVELDGDDYPPEAEAEARDELTAALAVMVANETIRGFKII